jgi:hypothetical protein
MKMEYGLSSAGADVEDGAVSLLDVAPAGDLGCGEVAAADEFGVACLGFFQSRKMLPGNDENMRRCLWLDVFEGENVIVFVNFLRGDLAAENAAEQAAGSDVSHDKWVSTLRSPVKQTIAPDPAECQQRRLDLPMIAGKPVELRSTDSPGGCSHLGNPRIHYQRKDMTGFCAAGAHHASLA